MSSNFTAKSPSLQDNKIKSADEIKITLEGSKEELLINKSKNPIELTKPKEIKIQKIEKKKIIFIEKEFKFRESILT